MRRLRRGKHRKKRRPAAPVEPAPDRRDAMTQKIAAADRRRQQDSYHGDELQRDLDLLGWISRRNRKDEP